MLKIGYLWDVVQVLDNIIYLVLKNIRVNRHTSLLLSPSFQMRTILGIFCLLLLMMISYQYKEKNFSSETYSFSSKRRQKIKINK